MTAVENTFGANARLHPITLMPLESGIGALPDDHQAALHVHVIEQQHGKEAADAMRKKLGIKTAAEMARTAAQQETATTQLIGALAAKVKALEDRCKAIESRFTTGMKELEHRIDEENVEGEN